MICEFSVITQTSAYAFVLYSSLVMQKDGVYTYVNFT